MEIAVLVMGSPEHGVVLVIAMDCSPDDLWTMQWL